MKVASTTCASTVCLLLSHRTVATYSVDTVANTCRIGIVSGHPISRLVRSPEHRLCAQQRRVEDFYFGSLRELISMRTRLVSVIGYTHLGYQ